MVLTYFLSMRTLLFLLLLLSAASCAPRVYWPQGHYHRAAIPATAPADPIARAAYIQRLDSLTAQLWSGTARIDMLEEGRDYQGWSPAPAKCQQRVFSLFKKK